MNDWALTNTVHGMLHYSGVVILSTKNTGISEGLQSSLKDPSLISHPILLVLVAPVQVDRLFETILLLISCELRANINLFPNIPCHSVFSYGHLKSRIS